MSKKTKKSKVASRKKSARVSRKKSRLPFFIALGAIVAVGITAGAVAGILARGGGGSEEIKLPSFAYSPTAPKGAAKAYRFAVDNPEYLAAVPCYCGCAELEAHKSNLDCYVKSREGNKIEFDDHASY